MTERLDELIPTSQALPVTPSTRYLAAETMRKRGFDPVERLIDLAEELEEFDRHAEVPVNWDRRMKVYSSLLKYHAPQPKSIDINVQSDQRQVIQVVSYKSLAEERRQYIPVQKEYQGPRLMDVVEAEVLEELEDDA